MQDAQARAAKQSEICEMRKTRIANGGERNTVFKLMNLKAVQTISDRIMKMVRDTSLHPSHTSFHTSFQAPGGKPVAQ